MLMERLVLAAIKGLSTDRKEESYKSCQMQKSN